MAEPRYLPKDFCEEPRAFGKSRNIRWKTYEEVEDEVLLHAAQLQHFYACRINEAARTARMKLTAFTGATTSTHNRWLRCLRGEIVMRLDDLAWGEQVFGSISELGRARAAAEQRAVATTKRPTR